MLGVSSLGASDGVEFGNRIPFLTFEVFADEGGTAVGDVLSDASDRLVQPIVDQWIEGYAAYGRSIRSAIEPLIDALGIRLFDGGGVLRSRDSTPIAVEDDHLGSAAGPSEAPPYLREQAPVSAVAGVLALGYYDLDREFQGGEARVVASDQAASEEQIQLPIATRPGTARLIAEHMLKGRWDRRDKLTLRLPPRYLATVPGDLVHVSLSLQPWRVERVVVEAFTVIVDLMPASAPLMLPAAVTASRSMVRAATTSAESLSVVLFDIPRPWSPPGDDISLLVAASSPEPGWKSAPVQIRGAGREFWLRTAARKTVLGRGGSPLPPAQPWLIDCGAELDVELIDHDQWLTSCTDEALAGGANLAILGAELLQFGEAIPLSGGRFRLRRLVRGRAGTHQSSDHPKAGEWFALLDRDMLAEVTLPYWARGTEVTAVPRLGDGSPGSEFCLRATGESLRPLPPAHLRASTDDGGNLGLEWIRCSRTGAWVDELDVPLDARSERYRVTLRTSGTAITREVGSPAIAISPENLGDLGTGEATVEVRTIGDSGLSRPALLAIRIP